MPIAHVTSQRHDVETTVQLLRDAAIMTLRHEHVVQSVASWPLLESELFCKELLFLAMSYSNGGVM